LTRGIVGSKRIVRHSGTMETRGGVRDWRMPAEEEVCMARVTAMCYTPADTGRMVELKNG
jgi:hypothetical protein